MHLLLALTFCPALAAPQERAPVELRDHEFRARSGASVAARIGSFVVPENRSFEGSRDLTLRFVLLPSTAEEPGSPIVYLAGGPGGSGIQAGRGTRFAMMDALRALGPVVLLDQRGTGQSDGPPSVPATGWSAPLDEPADAASLVAAAAAGLERAGEVWRAAGVDLDGYTTEESADDLADLAAALGVERLRLVGISYGTHLALATMRRHPALVERAVLAGVEGPDHTFKLPSEQQALLERIAGWIAADPEAAERWPDFLGALGRVLRRLEEQPVTVETDAGRRVVCAIDVRRHVAGALRGPESFRGLPALVARLEAGDFAELAERLPGLRSGGFEIMPLAMDLASGASPERLERIRREATTTLLGDAINLPEGRLAGVLGVRDLGAGFRAPLVSDVPVLAISGTADGRTPPSNAEEVLATLANGHHLVLEGAGHSDPLFLSSPEILARMLRFLAGETPSLERIRLDPPRFVR